MLKNFLQLCFLYFILPVCSFGQDRQFDELDLTNINGTTSIEFRKDDKDLLELGKSIGNKQIVMLGEFTHQEATTFKAKARIVRYLIEKKGFQVLALENSMGEVYRINQQARDKEDFLSFISSNDFSVNNDEIVFWKYVYAFSSPTSKKIDLYGFDIFFNQTPYGFLCFLEQEIKYATPNITQTKDWEIYKQLFVRLLSLNKNELDDFKNLTENLIDQSKKNLFKDQIRISYIIQLLKNSYGLAYFSAFSPPFPSKEALKLFFEEARYYELRDKQMAENLNWIIDRALSSGKKVIVWSSTYHLLRNIDKIQGIDTVRIKPMGQYLWEKYPGKTYSIGFVGYDRKPGIIHHKEGIPKNQKRENYEAKVVNDKGDLIGTVLIKGSVAIDTSFVEQHPLAKEGSLEYLLHEKNVKFAFVDLSRDLKDKKFYLFPTFDKPYYAKWSEVLDGVYFMDKIEPFHRKSLQSYNREINYVEKLNWFWPLKDCNR